MKKHFKKRLAAFKVGLVLSIMITPFCFYKMATPVAALTNTITTNNYGSFERINETFSVGGVVGFSASSVRGNLNGTYDGTVRIYISISGNATIADFSVVPDNCFIQYYSSSYIDIAFNGVSQWEVTFIGTTYNAHSYITIQSLSNWNMSYIGQSTDNMIKDIYTHLDDLEAYTGACNRSIIRCENLLTTIANNGTGGGSQIITNIDTNVDLAVDDLNLLKTSNDSILSTLLSFLTDSLGQVITLDSLMTEIDSAITELQSINTQLTTLQTSIDGILTAINNIDNQIDTISWKSYTTPSSIAYAYGNNTSSYTNYTSGNILFSNPRIILRLATQALRYSRLYKLTLPFYYYQDGANNGYQIEVVSNVGSTTNEVATYYTANSESQIVVYFVANGSVNMSNMYISFEKSGTKGGLYAKGTMKLEYIEPNDIEYWQLLQFFNQYDMNKKMLNALQNLSININGDIVTQTENVINNYDTDFTTINNIESTFTTNFDNTNPGVISLFNSNLQIPQGFVDGSTFVKTLFPKVVDTNGLVGFPYFLILAIVVLIVILG